MSSHSGHAALSDDDCLLPNATMAAPADQTVEHEETAAPKMSHSWTYWYARLTEPNEYEFLPCPVATQGAHLISAPSSPRAVKPRHDASSFCRDLSERLRGLIVRQSLRENLYGEEFADEWPISRTPRALANEVLEARQKALEAQPHLYSPPSESTVDFESSWRRRIREWREKKRQGKKRKGPPPLAPSAKKSKVL
ncbi:hypothetical protein V8C37DRAFT_384120 [Trichoderma ceciliae]